ncbi:hypothetical protein EYC80_010801 [Monilinia laxa]|uniref:DUF676 domain-containing protein n=1 Tax=Monilinia laxa TaxID=61186 RepID=A0A5N6JP82_MONLA|nr:hypothetical protein EYC80_010801 [Monilinia laxa]
MKFGKTRSKSITAVLPTYSNVLPPGHNSPTSNNSSPSVLPQKILPPVRTGRFGLFHLNPEPIPPREGETSYKLDIVALHGIKGDAYNTWTEKNGNLWLRDQLPNELPGARIFSYGYDANVLFSRGTGDIEDFAVALLENLVRERNNSLSRKRRIIFICHSMGGIVIKKALTKASSNTTYKNIFNSTSAILFLATPHGGSDETKLPLYLANFANGILAFLMRFSGRVRDDLITPLSRGSSVLRDAQDEFKKQKLHESIRIASFLETDTCAGLKGLVVDAESARLHITNERVVKMDGCDHRNICRFSGPESPSYLMVWGILKEYADEANIMVPDELTSEDEAVLSSIQYPEMKLRRHDADCAYPGTCTWIFKKRAYIDWKNEDRSLIWIKGKPGAGKSTLMAYILSNFRHHDPRILVLHFFFHGRGSSLQKSPEGMYRQLLHQLYSQASPIREQLRKSFAEKNNLRQSNDDCVWAENELKDWLMYAITWIAKSQPVAIFVDALDETGDDNARILINYFNDMKKIVSREGGSIRICISCRHYPNVSLSDGFEVNVENCNRQDIAVFVHLSLDERVRIWDDDPVAIDGRAKMEEAIVKKSLGVFQWPQRCSCYVGKAEYRSKTLLLMQWVALAERPLTATELRIAMACDEGSDNPGHKRWEDNKDYIESDRRMETLMKSLSGGLVEIALYTSGLYRVQFIHQTVVDFMLSGGLLYLAHRLPPQVIEICEVKDKVSNTQVIGQSQDRLSRSCVNYFKQPEISQENWVDDSEKVEEMKAQKYPFLNYAIEKWSIHAEKAERQGQCQKHLVKQLEEPPVFFKVYINMLRAVAIHNYGVQRGSTILHLMAYANLQGPAQEIIQRGDSIEDQDQSWSRPLHCAAYQGHKKMVQLLLDAGADIRATQDGRSTALEVAASRHHDNVIQVLLERGANINDVSNSGTALEGACFSGDIKLVQKLLAIGADVNPESKFGSTPLKAAARKGHADIVRLLLEKGASIDEYDDYNGTALQTAAWAGQIEVVRMLLENGASVNAQGGNFGSALQCAADATSLYNNIGATIELLKLLLDYGADVNMGGGPWGSPFAAAVRGFGSMESNNGDIDPRILLLLGRGADVNAPHGKSGNALIAAASHGNIKLMSLILDRGADINALTDYGDTALAIASDTFWKAYPNAVKFLLDRGADVNLHFSSVGYSLGGPPIQRAAKRGRLEIVQMLVNAGADLNAGAGRAGTALCAAASNGHIEICQLLLNLGADIHAGGMNGTGLHGAAEWGHVEILRLLLANGARIDNDCKMWGTALQMAAIQGRLNSFCFLLGKGADIHHIGGYHHNVLQASAHGGNVEIVEQCLDSGIDVNIRGDGEVQTPLLAAVQQGHAEVVKLLLDRGARDLNEGWLSSVWYHAESRGHREVLKILRQNGITKLTR